MNFIKKILILSAHFPPEPMSTERLQYEPLQSLVTAGFRGEVICPVPTRGISNETRRAYGKRKAEVLHDGMVVIRRVYLPNEVGNPLLRAVRYFLQSIIQFFKATRVRYADMLFCASTLSTPGALCGLIGRKLKVPFVYNVQDIFPDSMVNAGLTSKESLLWRPGRKIKDCSYRKPDEIIAIRYAAKRNIVAKGVPTKKIEVIYNWASTNIVPIPRQENKLCDLLRLDRNSFCITYAGNLGLIQNLGLLLDAAALLQDQQDIRFLIFGAGAELEQLSRRAHDMPNVQMFPLMPKDQLSEVYGLGNLSLVIARKGLGGAPMPSKTWSIMASGTPVLLSFGENSELWQLVKERQCGVCAEADDAHQLVSAILNVYGDRELQNTLAANARVFAENEVSYRSCSMKYVGTLEKLVSGASSNVEPQERITL